MINCPFTIDRSFLQQNHRHQKVRQVVPGPRALSPRENSPVFGGGGHGGVGVFYSDSLGYQWEVVGYMGFL